MIRNKEYLAKGKRGVVYTADWITEDGKQIRVAIKEKRESSEAVGRIENEAKFLKILNKYNIGPVYLDSGKDWLMYKFVEGKPILDFIEENSKENIIEVLKEVLSQCKKMDDLGINKEEMHHPYKHILVGEKVVMIDFERCRYSEKVHNVTQFIQFLTSTKLSKVLKEKGILINIEEMRKLGLEYKEDKRVYEKVETYFFK